MRLQAEDDCEGVEAAQSFISLDLQVLSEDRKTHQLVPTWQGTEALESINNALHPLQEPTHALSGDANVSVSYLKTVLHLLRTSISAENDEDLTKAVNSRALAYLEDKYSVPCHTGTFGLHFLSFDPGFKINFIKRRERPRY